MLGRVAEGLDGWSLQQFGEDVGVGGGGSLGDEVDGGAGRVGRLGEGQERLQGVEGACLFHGKLVRDGTGVAIGGRGLMSVECCLQLAALELPGGDDVRPGARTRLAGGGRRWLWSRLRAVGASLIWHWHGHSSITRAVAPLSSWRAVRSRPKAPLRRAEGKRRGFRGSHVSDGLPWPSCINVSDRCGRPKLQRT